MAKGFHLGERLTLVVVELLCHIRLTEFKLLEAAVKQMKCISVQISDYQSNCTYVSKQHNVPP